METAPKAPSALGRPEEFENGGFTPKPHQIFSVHTTSEEFQNATITGHFGFVLRKTRLGKSRDYVFEKLRFQNVLRPHENRLKAGVFNSSGLKSVFEKLRFRDGLVLTVGLTVDSLRSSCFLFPVSRRAKKRASNGARPG